MKIGEKTLKKGGEMLTNALLTYQKEINEAFRKTGEMGALKISLSLSINPGVGNGSFLLRADISFIAEKISDSFSDKSDELQTTLDDAIENMRPDANSSIESVTISAGKTSVTLPRKEKKK
jgi:hypothetical protein